MKRRFYKRIILFATLVCNIFITYSQKTITGLLDELNKTTSPRVKADVCYEISRRYSTVLKIDSALYFADKVKEYSQQNNYGTGVGKYHLALSAALNFRGKYEESEENAVKAIEIFARQRENALIGHAYNQLAQSQYGANKITLSRKNYWNALVFFNAENPSGLFLSYFWLARTYFKTSEIDSAAFYYVKALSAAEVLNDSARIHQTACLAGKLFWSLGDLDKAIRYYEQGLKIAPSKADKVGLRFFLRDYGICLALSHQFLKTDSVIHEVESLNSILKDRYGTLVTNRMKGTLEYERRNYPIAIGYLLPAFNIGHELKVSNSDVRDIALLLAKSEFETHAYDSAIVHLRSAAEMSRELRELTDEAEANLLISKAYQQKGNTDTALFYFKSYSLLKDSILSIEKQKTIIDVTTRYETEKKEQEIRMLQKEGEANSYLLQLKNQQIEKQQLEDDKKSQQLAIVSQQNEIIKLDATQKTLSLDNEIKENEKNQAKLKLLEQETAYQKLLASKQNQQRKIVIIGIAVILTFTGFIFYRYVRRKRMENQQQVLNERLRISRELHDEVGSTLSGIAMYSHLTWEQIKTAKTEEVERSLNNIQQSAAEMMNKLSDIVWLVNPEKDSFQKLIERLEEFAINMARTKNIEMKISLPDKLNGINLPVEARRDIYLFCKEAINNAVKYSNATTIELTMRETGNKKIEILVGDNGSGFNASAVKKGNGLVNMQQRAEQVNGVYLLESAPGHGTNISLSFKIT